MYHYLNSIYNFRLYPISIHLLILKRVQNV
nr:MAG TPA: hypothetical protein [Bacteriophage sp.]